MQHGEDHMQTYVGHLQKFDCLRHNKIHRYYPKFQYIFSDSIYLLSHIKPKENCTSVKKFHGARKWSLHTWPLDMYMRVMSSYNSWWSYY